MVLSPLKKGVTMGEVIREDSDVAGKRFIKTLNKRTKEDHL